MCLIAILESLKMNLANCTPHNTDMLVRESHMLPAVGTNARNIDWGDRRIFACIIIWCAEPPNQ